MRSFLLLCKVSENRFKVSSGINNHCKESTLHQRSNRASGSKGCIVKFNNWSTQSPILSISNTSYLHICHQSVADFLLDSECSQDLWVDPQLYSLCFAGSCLKLMNAKLKFNFFDLKTSYTLNKDIPELNDHIKSVKCTALDHASYFWAT